MKQRFSLSRLMHNDKLMMLVSLVLAIVVWALVVYGPSNVQEQVITGVPVSITLNDYASQTLNLRITSGSNATATVRVYGPRVVVSKLSAADITVTADTGNVIKEGTYTLPLRATSSGDYSIVSVVGDDGTSNTVTISCDAWREVSFPVSVEMPGLSVLDEQSLQFGTPVVSGDAVVDGQVTVTGPRTDINRISSVVAVIPDTEIIDEAKVYTAKLTARDEAGDEITTVSFTNAEDGNVSVTVPVLVYRRGELSPSRLHAPAAYQNNTGLVSVSPSAVELWGVPSELDEYIANLQNQLRVDFDQLSPSTLTRQIALKTVEGVRPVNGSETITVKVQLSGMSTRTLEVPLSASNFTVLNCPAGYKVNLSQSKLSELVLCGDAKTLKQVNVNDILVTLDMAGAATPGKQTLTARVSVRNRDGVWVYYGENQHGVAVLVTVNQS